MENPLETLQGECYTIARCNMLYLLILCIRLALTVFEQGIKAIEFPFCQIPKISKFDSLTFIALAEQLLYFLVRYLTQLEQTT